MAVSREEVLQIAALARLRLGESEVERLTLQLNDILAHVEELAEVEALAGADPAPQEDLGWRVEWAAPQRADEPGADALHGDLDALAPSFREGFFVVPRLGAMGDGEEGEGGADADADGAAGGGHG